ncbi:MAG TPA: hypothetical protein VJ372_03225 [Pyrinomonadaceae bacterium]|jgi:hypothetical protein|nr:hypothetical protein [Pyrinomonadaceae bacterium]
MMVDFLSEFINSLTWRGALIGVLVFVVTFLVNLGIVSLILVKIPANYFKMNHKARFWSGPNPALHAAKFIGKNVLGVLLVSIGIVLSIPGVPGQGLLTILLGIMLLDFPGKSTLERKLLHRPEILKAINRLRARFHKPSLELD